MPTHEIPSITPVLLFFASSRQERVAGKACLEVFPEAVPPDHLNHLDPKRRKNIVRRSAFCAAVLGQGAARLNARFMQLRGLCHELLRA